MDLNPPKFKGLGKELANVWGCGNGDNWESD